MTGDTSRITLVSVLTCAMLSTAVSASVVDLAAWYTFDDGPADMSGNGNDLTLYNGASCSLGALQLSGSSQYAARAGGQSVIVPAGNAPYSWTADVVRDAATIKRNFLTWGRDGTGGLTSTLVGFTAASELRVNHLSSTSDWTSSYIAPTGVSVRLAGTHHGRTERVYANGGLQDKFVNGAPLAIPSEAITVGALFPWGHGEYFDGRINDVSLWGRNLWVEDIAELASGAATVSQIAQRVANRRVIIDDDFDDDTPTSTERVKGNLYGTGQGHTVLSADCIQAEGGTQWAVFSPTWYWGRAEISSKDEFSWKSGRNQGIVTEWVVQDAGIYSTGDNSTYISAMHNGEYSDFRNQFGLVSANRDNNDQTYDQLFNNTEGGVYVNLFYERESSDRDVTITGSVRVVNKNHPNNSDYDSAAGLVTIGTFSLGRHEFVPGSEADDFSVRIEADADGFVVRFFDLSTGEDILPGDLVGSMGGLWSSLTSVYQYGGVYETITITDEFDNGAFAYCMGQQVWNGKGWVELDRLTVTEILPEPTSLMLLAAGAGLLLRRRGGPR